MTARLSVDFITPPASPPLPGILLLDAPKLDSLAAAVDEVLGGAVARAIKEADFKAKQGETLTVRAGAGTAVLLGTGADDDDNDNEAAQQSLVDTGGAIFTAMDQAALKSATVYAGDMADTADLAYGAVLASYHFPHYFTKDKDRDKKADPKPKHRLAFACPDPEVAKKAFAAAAHRIAGVYLARDLVSEPANVLYPAEYARRCQQALTRHGIKLDVLDEAQMEKLGMRLLLSVGQGSGRESRLVVMHWNGGAAKSPPIALIGKGVCFDSGGISIKPAAGMEDMKWDMGGSAAVVGAMRAIAGLGLKQNVVGLIGLVENMPDGKATRPGDVVASMAGQTVEIINTDAEGRLVLADVLTYTARHIKPALMVDLATLTGAIIIALGHSNAGLFANDDGLAAAILGASKATGDSVWRMPLAEDYNKLLKSTIADVKNIGGRWAGAVTAACFLQRFVAKKTPWAHIDIAGMAWADKASATTPAGGTGFGVRLLTKFVEDYQASSEAK